MTRALKYFFLVLTLCFYQFTSLAQQTKIDSLKNLLHKSKEDTNKVNRLNHIGWELMYKNLDSSIILGNQELSLAQKLKWKKGIASSLSTLGTYYYLKSDFLKAIDYYLKALKLDEEMLSEAKNPSEKQAAQRGITIRFFNLGNIYLAQSDYPKTLDYYFKALKIDEELGNKHGIATDISSIGIVYAEQKDYSKALEYFFKALKIAEELEDKNGIVFAIANIGNVYDIQGHNSKALDYSFKALKINEELEDKNGIAIALGNIGSLYTKTGKFKEAEQYLKRAIALDDSIGNQNALRQWEEALSQLYDTIGKYRLALIHYKKAMVLKDTLFNKDKNKEITRKGMNYEFEKKEAVAAAESRKQKIVIWLVASGLLLVMVFAGFVFRSLHVTRKQKQIIEAKSNEMEQQKQIIVEKNKEILDSINYAQRIQKAILPPLIEVSKALPQSFVLFKPKDIVSGDFYWFAETENKILIAAADCTGHGVPGAFMSTIGAEKLNEAVTNGDDVSAILQSVNIRMKKVLRQSNKEDSTRDGMDIAICAFNKEMTKVEYAGANRPVWIIRNNKKEIEETKATKVAIGGFTDDEQAFVKHKIELQKGDSIYIFTDGFADQFSPDDKKLMAKKFKEIILSIQYKSMEEQKIFLDSFIVNWKGNMEQTDDILVIGLRV